jgi:Flp pilus assembly protein TadG
MLKSCKHSRTEKGQSLVELTISLAIIIMLLIGVVDFGLAFFSWVAIRDASQEGAIYGAVCPANQVAIEARVRTTSATPVDMSDGARVRVFIAPIIVDPDNPASAPLGVPGDPVTVQVEFDYQSLTPVASSFIGQNGFLTLRASTTNTILTTTEPSCP